MIYVCVPAYNEERTIGVLLWKIRKVMWEFGRDFEVLVLDDASTDATASVLNRYDGSLPLRVVRADDRLGHGRAIVRLLQEVVGRSPYPKRDIAVTIQADFSEDPADLVPMVKKIEGGADLVAGTLVGGETVLSRSQRVSRWLAPHLLGRAHREAPVSDPISGYRAYRVIVLKKAFRGLGQDTGVLGAGGWSANVKLLSTVVPHARRIEESPIQLRRHPKERVSRFSAASSLRTLLATRGVSWPQPPGSDSPS